jgi:hypothetical protein
MSKFNTHTQAADNRTRIADQQRAAHAAAAGTRKASMAASSRLQPFDRSGPLGVRRTDIEVFAAAAEYFEHIVLLRSTNEHALKYIGRKAYAPKPIDCKPKTADHNAYVPGLVNQVECSGLVVDPTAVGFSAFAGDKPGKAREEWAKFIGSRTPGEQERKIYPRHETKGFYAVDTNHASKHFGCLMLSEQEIPGPTFRLDSSDWGDFKRHHMRYIHGDYDLYGLIDVAATERAMRHSGGREKFSPELMRETLHGVPHIYSARFKEIRAFINSAIGFDMIQHDGQANLEHSGDTLYVFYPIGSKYTVTASADAIREIYDHVFLQEARN